MNYEELIAYCKDAIKKFEADMAVADNNYEKEDYAYAEGARNAYKVILNNLDELDPEED